MSKKRLSGDPNQGSFFQKKEEYVDQPEERSRKEGKERLPCRYLAVDIVERKLECQSCPTKHFVILVDPRRDVKTLRSLILRKELDLAEAEKLTQLRIGGENL